MTDIILITLKQMYFVPKVLLLMLLGLLLAELLMNGKSLALWLKSKISKLRRYAALNRIFKIGGFFGHSEFLIKIFQIAGFFGKRLSRFMLAAVKLPKQLIALIPIAFSSTIAANAALLSWYNQKIINLDQKKLMLAAILNSVPTYLRQVLVYHLPVLIPILGWKIGGMYLCCYMLAAVFKILYCSVVSNFYYFRKNKKEKPAICLSDGKNQKRRVKQESFLKRKIAALFRLVQIRYPKIPDKAVGSAAKIAAFFLRISANLVVITFLVLFLINSGYLDGLFNLVSPLLKFVNLPPQLIAPLATFVGGHIVSGAGIISTFTRSGIITETQALLALVLGALIGLPVFTLRQVLPNYTAVFGWRLGIKIVAVAFSIALFTRIATVIFLTILII